MSCFGYNKYFFQKCLVGAMTVLANSILIVLSIIYHQYWYIFHIPLFIFIGNKMIILTLILVCVIFFRKHQKAKTTNNNSYNIAYFIPCYNQTAEEINNSLNSFLRQKDMTKHSEFVVTICDGRKKGKGNKLSTDQILIEQIFLNAERVHMKSAYTNGAKQVLDLEILTGTCGENMVPFYTIIKDKNQGKRDSIGIVRRLLLAFNNKRPNDYISQAFLDHFCAHIWAHKIYKTDMIIGVDADTEFEDDCASKLVAEITSSPTTLASTGIIKVAYTGTQTFREKLWKGYQHVEYTIGQTFLRFQQTLTQQKVSCLPGCLNITKICEETCGQELLKGYLTPAGPNDSIFVHIKGSASEDRHIVMLLLNRYPNSHTTMEMNAQAITSVPTSLQVFLSQRKRWSLGSSTHGFSMALMKNLPFWQRTSSFINVFTYLFSPFLGYSMAGWIRTVIVGSSSTFFWIVTAVVHVTTYYKLLAPSFFPFKLQQKLRFYKYFLLYLILSPFVALMVLSYSFYYMDDFSWGKTRAVAEQQKQPIQTIDEINPEMFETQKSVVHLMNDEISTDVNSSRSTVTVTPGSDKMFNDQQEYAEPVSDAFLRPQISVI